MGLLDNTEPEAYYEGTSHGNYQFISLDEVINQFMLAYVGEDKIIPKARRVDVQFHAARALRELSFDTFKSCKGQEITVPPSLQMTLPQDYVNYTKVSWVDSVGIKHPLYPTSNTSNPTNPLQNSDGEFRFDPLGTQTAGSNTIVLDDDYSDIIINGLTVSGYGIPSGTYLGYASTTSGITSITLRNAVNTSNKNALQTGTFRLKISGYNSMPWGPTPCGSCGDLIPDITPIKTTIATTITGTQLYVEIPVADIAGIEEGMVVSSFNYPWNTKVVSVGTNLVVVDTAEIFLPASAGTEITFTSTENASDTWSNYKSSSSTKNQNKYNDDDYWPLDGSRFGLDPQYANINGSYYIDCTSGKIRFSSNMSGKTVILDYISDSLGTDGEMQVHKFAEEAMYKWIAYGIVSARMGIPEYVVQRFKKERFAETRKAKLRLSNIKIEEITKILRGKSKQIKH